MLTIETLIERLESKAKDRAVDVFCVAGYEISVDQYANCCGDDDEEYNPYYESEPDVVLVDETRRDEFLMRYNRRLYHIAQQQQNKIEYLERKIFLVKQLMK